MYRKEGVVIGLNAEINYVRLIRLTIWAYFFLLIFEGALRKWVIPSASMALFAIRAPVVISAYALAIRIGRFPFNIFTVSLLLIAVASFFAGWAAPDSSLFVTLAGAHSNFVHVPFIFIMGAFMDRRDVRMIGFWFLLIALPMAILMIFQFKAGPFSYINFGAGGDEGTQALSAIGKIRPSGTFTFNTGVACFYGTVAAFMIYGMFIPKSYPWWLNLAAGASLIAATAVSGNRTLIASYGIVLFCALVAALFQPKLLAKYARMVAIVLVAAAIGSLFPVVREGFEVLYERFYLANMSEGGVGGTAGRFMHAFTHPVELFFEVPLFGHGLGLGTNAGAQLMTGGRTFLLLVEGEWDRIMMESGPIFGTAFIVWRIYLVAWMGVMSLISAYRENIMPILVFAVSGLLLFFGQFGPVTNLGFAVLLSGMCLASMNVDEAPAVVEEVEEEEDSIATKAMRRRLA